MDLGAADRAAERALDHRQGALAECLGERREELVGVGRREVLEPGRADPRADPVLGLAGDDRHRVRVSIEGGEPVFDALLDGVRGRRADACGYPFVELGELVLDFGLGPAADGRAVALAAGLGAERDRAYVASVGLVSPDAVVAEVAATLPRLGGWSLVSHRASILSRLTSSFLRPYRKTSLDVPGG